MGVGSTITNSFAYVSGSITGGDQVGGLIGVFDGNLEDIIDSYVSFGSLQANDGSLLIGTLAGDRYGVAVNFSEEQNIDLPALPSILSVVNTDYETEPFAVSGCFISGLPYLTALTDSYSNTCSVDEEVSPQININFPFLLTQAQDSLSTSAGFEIAKNEFSEFNFAFADQIKGDKSATITGAKLFANQSLTTSISVGSILQLGINFEANKSLQMWVKSSDSQYVLVGDVTFDKDGNAVLPGIEFNRNGQYELIFVNSDKNNLTQPELVNRVISLTVYVN
jgi:hypothetical protein